MAPSSLIDKVLAGDRRAIARAITLIENRDPKAEAISNTLFPMAGDARRIGITGPPGAGKSSLVNKLTEHFCSDGKKVGIISVDPTSPFSGGALLGDRIRMSALGARDDVFIRSMATRGSIGGLSAQAADAADILSAGGYDIVIFETVGVGQSEVDIADNADTTAVVLVPESGDAIQAMKAGLMEIADLFVLNKNDRPGASQTEAALNMILRFAPEEDGGWQKTILRTTAPEGKGVKEVYDRINEHNQWLQADNRLTRKREEALAKRIRVILQQKMTMLFNNDVVGIGGRMEVMARGDMNDGPYESADRLMQIFRGRGRGGHE